MATTMTAQFFETADRCADRIALRHKVAGVWRETTWREYAALARRAAKALIALGVPEGGTVAILGPNRPEWLIAAVGAMSAGAAPAGIYMTSTAEQATYVAAHAESVVLIANDKSQLDKLRAHRDQLPKLRHLVQMEGEPESEDALGWQRFLASGDSIPDEELNRRIANVTPDQPATLIYTSGTTGTPKAVVVTHDNLVFIGERFQAMLDFDEREQILSYLPLSHIAEQNISLHGAISNGYCVSFCDSLDRLGDFLREVRPTLLFAVPRVWEKIQAKMVEAAASSSPLKKKIAAWARGVGLRAGRARIEGRPMPLAYGFAKKLVFDKVRERLGLDRCKLCVSGAAAISRATLEFFLSLDIPIYEIYGQSEGAACASTNLPGIHKVGTVGKPIPGIELKIAADGEILLRGRHVFKGYLKDEAATKETIDEEGWLHTGDVGEIDRDGFLRITDRKKDLFKTAGGKYIAPQYLEGLLTTIPGVAQAAVIGDGRKFAVALLTLDPEAAPRVAAAAGARGRTVAELADDPAFLQTIEAALKKINSGLAPYETIKKVKVLPREFSIEGGELTPTMKLKRRVVSERYASEIEALYREPQSEARAESA